MAYSWFRVMFFIITPERIRQLSSQSPIMLGWVREGYRQIVTIYPKQIIIITELITTDEVSVEPQMTPKCLIAYSVRCKIRSGNDVQYNNICHYVHLLKLEIWKLHCITITLINHIYLLDLYNLQIFENNVPCMKKMYMKQGITLALK